VELLTSGKELLAAEIPEARRKAAVALDVEREVEVRFLADANILAPEATCPAHEFSLEKRFHEVVRGSAASALALSASVARALLVLGGGGGGRG
jgi:hypothetical protein